MSRPRRQSITFSGKGAEVLERLAKDRGVTVSEIVRQALMLEDWRERVEKADQKIFVGPSRDEALEIRFVS